MKGFFHRITLVTLSLAMALTLMLTPSMAEEMLCSGYAFINERYETLGDFDYWPLEEKAAFSEWRREHAEQGDKDALYEVSVMVYGVPGEDNMTLEEAVNLARQGIIAKYAVKEAVLLGKFKAEVEFFIHFYNEFNFEGAVIDQDHPMWRMTFRVKDYDDMEELGHYTVMIYDRTREMVLYSAADSQG